jgi:hypothetical protein
MKEDVNRQLDKIKSPHNISRKVGSLDHLPMWKSTELKTFIFYLAIPLLFDKLPEPYFYMLASYVIATRLLYEPIDELSEIDIAEKIFDKYHEQLAESFGDFAYTYTIHAHLHLAKQVRMHGPLKSHSQFVFEVKLTNF